MVPEPDWLIYTPLSILNMLLVAIPIEGTTFPAVSVNAVWVLSFTKVLYTFIIVIYWPP
jgi:hypothetical protein